MSIEIRTQRATIRLYDRHEVAVILGVSDRTIWNYIKDERIPAQLIGQKWYISEQNLCAFIHGARYTAEGQRIGRGRKHRKVRQDQRVDPPKYTGIYYEGMPDYNQYHDVSF